MAVHEGLEDVAYGPVWSRSTFDAYMVVVFGAV